MFGDIHVEIDRASISVMGKVEEGHRTSVSLSGRRWSTDIDGDIDYYEQVWIEVYSDKEDLLNEIGKPGKSYGKIWCAEHDGVKEINISVLLPDGWFESVVNMSLNFNREHYFSTRFRTADQTEYKVEKYSFMQPGGPGSEVVAIDIAMSRRTAQKDR